MSDIRIVGTLLDPVGNPIQWAIIRFTALTTEGDTFEGADASGQSGASGQYDFTVQQGRYRLEILYSDEYIESGEVLIDEHTPTGITLQELVRYTSPYTPPLVLDTDPNWELLLQGVIDGDEWDRQEESQVRDKEVLVNDDKAIHKDGDAYVAKRTHSASTGSAASTHEQVTYEDNANQKASASTQEDVVGTGKATHTQGIYQSSDGSQEAVSESSLITDTGSITEGKVASESLVSSESTQQGNSVTRIKSDRAEATHTDDEGQPNATPRGKAEKSLKLSQGAHEAEVTSEEVVRYVDAEDVVEALLKQGIKIKYAKPDGFPMEYFDEMSVSKDGGTKTTQIDKMVVQGRDGFPVMDIDTENREIVLDAKLTFQNTDDFIGEEGYTYAWEFQFSKDKGVTDPWHDEYDADHPDIWRKDQQVKWQGEDQRNYQLVGAPEIIQLNGEDGTDGDNFYMEEQYTTDGAYPSGWDATYTSGDDWRRWRTIRVTANGTEISDWTETRLKGTDGPSGWIPEWETYYGRNATDYFHQSDPSQTYGSWSKNLTDSDAYKWERTVWWKSQEDFEQARNAQGGIDWDKAPAAGSAGIWVGPTKIKPVEGEDYGAKTAQIFLYKRATSMPSDPPAMSYDFTTQTLSPLGSSWGGWSTSVVDGEGYLYVATAVAYSMTDSDSSINDWDVDKMAADGLKSATAYLYKVTSGDVTEITLYPTYEHVYDFSQGKITTTPQYSWMPTLPSNIEKGGKVWMIFAPVTAQAHEPTERIYPDDWEEAVLLSQNGIDGASGEDGDYGAGSYTFEVATLPTYDQEIDGYILGYTGREAKKGDLATFITSTTTRSWLRQEDIDTASSYQFVAYEEIQYRFDGSVIVEETLAAKALRAKSITGDQISSSATIIAGSGTTTAGMNGLDEGNYEHYRFWSGGEYPASANWRVGRTGNTYSGTGNDIVVTSGSDATWRLWAGHATPTSAPFRVNKDGELYASGVNISGHIEADSGTFAGSLEGANGTFTGTVYAANLEGDVIDTGIFDYPVGYSVTDHLGRPAWLLNGGSSLRGGSEYQICTVTIPAEPNFARTIRMQGDWGIVHNDGTDAIYSGALRAYRGSTKVYDQGTTSINAYATTREIFCRDSIEISIPASGTDTLITFKFYCVDETGGPARAYISVVAGGSHTAKHSIEIQDSEDGIWYPANSYRVITSEGTGNSGLEYALFKQIPKKYFNT